MKYGSGGAGGKYHFDDEILGKAYDSRLMKRLMTYLRPYRWSGVLTFIFITLLTFSFLAGPYLIALVIDEGILPKNRDLILFWSAAFLVSRLLHLTFMAISNYCLVWLGQKIMFDLRMEVFSHLQRMSLKFFDKNPVGRLVTRATNDTAAISELFSSGLITAFRDIFLILGLIIAMAWFNFKLTLITLSVLPFIAMLTIYFKAKMRGAYREVRQKIAQLNAFIQETISGIRVIHVFSQEIKNFKRFNDLNNRHYSAVRHGLSYQAVFMPLVSFIASVSVALIIYYGGGQAIQQTVKLGALVAFINYATHFFEPIRDLADKYTLFQSAMASAERVFGILDTPEGIRDPVNPVTLNNIKGEISFENVSFAYEAPNYVLKNISFKIQPGESIAIVGATGAGKSTIINLLNRFYEVNEGTITIDGIDIRKIRQADLRRHLGIVLQDVFLFAGNIIDNIRLGEDNITMEQMEKVARYVNADTFIEKLPGQYYAPVEERGSTLSTGQRQLLSFARALVFNPKILILDEATSSVDVQTESAIREAIQKLLKSRTCIIIAHRLSTIQNVDRIIVIHKGEIRETGTHQELLAKQGIYHKLYQSQYAQQLI